jgi:hypothetical protein
MPLGDKDLFFTFGDFVFFMSANYMGDILLAESPLIVQKYANRVIF